MDESKYKSAELVQMIKDGGVKENEAITFILEKNRRAITRYVCANSGQEADAEDLLQDCIMALREKVLSDGFNQRSTLSNYFFGIAKNQWYKLLKKRQIQVELDEIREGKAAVDPFDELIQQSLTVRDSWLRNELDQLGKNCRAVLLAKSAGQRSEHIAEDLGLGGKTVVDATATRCRRNLEKRLFKKLGNKCQEILRLYLPAKRQARRDGNYDPDQLTKKIAQKLAYETPHDAFVAKNRCMQQLYQLIFPDS